MKLSNSVDNVCEVVFMEWNVAPSNAIIFIAQTCSVPDLYCIYLDVTDSFWLLREITVRSAAESVTPGYTQVDVKRWIYRRTAYMNCLLLRYVAKNVNCNIVAKSIYFFSLSNWIFFTHNVFMFDFFFYFKAWKIDWEFVGTCFLDSLSHREFFFIFRLSANCQGARIWLWEVWMCSIQWIWSGIFLCCHALCQRCVSPSGHWKKEEN